MTVEKNKVVSVNYYLTSLDSPGGTETFVEETSAENPFVFLMGTGDLLEDFERNLMGKAAGDVFDFQIEKGYGAYDTESVIDIPLDAFKGPDGDVDFEMVALGRTLPMHDSEGNRLNGTVKNITEKLVTMDFNHPLAGKNLHFKGVILEVREATPDELSHGHVHGPHGHHH